MTESVVALQLDKLNQASDVLRAITHPLRIRIVDLIRQHGQIAVQSIYRTLDLDPSLTSQHLRTLRRADLVYTTKQGKHVYYHLNEEVYDQMLAAVGRFLAPQEV